MNDEPTGDSIPSVPPAPAEAPDDFKPMLIGAALIFVIGLIPFSALLCCLPQLGGALLAVHLFTATYRLTISYGRGIKLGILTCLVGGLALWVVAIAARLLFNYQFGAKESETIAVFFAKFGGPEAVKAVQDAIAAQQAQELGVAQILIQLLATAVFAAVLGLIGGALGAVLFKRGPKQPPEAARKL